MSGYVDGKVDENMDGEGRRKERDTVDGLTWYNWKQGMPKVPIGVE